MKLSKAAARAAKLDRHNACGYIYPDGLLVKEKVHGTLRGKSVEREIWHAIPGPIPIVITSRDGPTVGRIVAHNPTVLLDGVTRVEVYYGNASDKMKDRGMTCDTITLVTDRGARHRSDIFNFISSDFTIQPEDGAGIKPFADVVADLRDAGDLA
jgi:hypothetical protein